MTHVSTTQYNSLSASYDAVNDRPVSRAIVINIERVLAPHIRGARVLELACGTGFFTRHLLDWGAASVVGVDVSQAMVDVARTKFEAVDKCRFIVTDCAAPFDARGDEGKGFDLVFAAWLLNYAADEAQMTAMWKNISSHLKPGGRLVAVVPHPEEDPIVSAYVLLTLKWCSVPATHYSIPPASPFHGMPWHCDPALLLTQPNPIQLTKHRDRYASTTSTQPSPANTATAST